MASYLPGKRHAFQFQTLRFSARARARRDRRRSEALRPGSRVQQILGGCRCRETAFVIGRAGELEKIAHIGKSRQATRTSGSANRCPNRKSDRQLRKQATQRVFLRCGLVGVQLQAKSFGFAVPCPDFDGQQHALCCTSSEILHTCIIAASLCSMLPKSGGGLVFFRSMYRVAQKSSMPRRLLAASGEYSQIDLNVLDLGLTV